MWILFSLLAAFIWSCVSIVDKHVISKYNFQPAVFLFILNSLGLIIGVIVLLFINIEFSWPIIMGLLNGALYPTVNIFYFKAIKLEEVSRVVPWYALAPLLVVIGARIFLNEVLSLPQYAGVIMLLAGLFLLTFKKGLTIKPGKWMIFMSISAVILATQLLLEKYLLFSLKPLQLFAAIEIGAFIGFIPYLLNDWPLIKTALINNTKAIKVVILNELGTISSTFLMIMAISIGLVSLVTTLNSFGYLFLLISTIIISRFYPKIIKEELRGNVISLKAAAIILIIFGIYLIS